MVDAEPIIVMAIAVRSVSNVRDQIVMGTATTGIMAEVGRDRVGIVTVTSVVNRTAIAIVITTAINVVIKTVMEIATDAIKE